jgi:uncharacterized protein YebE (UPF0316 family)
MFLMAPVPFLDSWTFNYVILPLLIFFSRICDVSLGTIRIIFVSRGRKFLAPLLGFFEVLIWLVVITQVFRNITSVVTYVAYAAGFAMGNFVGIYIEERLAIGFAAIRIIGIRNMNKIVGAMTKRGYGITCQKGTGSEGPVTIIYSMVKRKELKNVTGIINKYNPGAFYSVEDARMANEGIFPKDKLPLSKKIRYFFRSLKPGK